MAHHFSFKTDVVPNDVCYYFDFSIGQWCLSHCTKCEAIISGSESIELYYSVYGYGRGMLKKERIANKVDFDEWRSRVIDTAVQQFNFKGNTENVFGPPSFNELLPMYIASKSPVTAYMASMGLLETDFEDE